MTLDVKKRLSFTKVLVRGGPNIEQSQRFAEYDQDRQQQPTTTLPGWAGMLLPRNKRGLYKGNIWTRPLMEDEWRILYFIMRELAFVYDLSIPACRNVIKWAKTPKDQGVVYLPLNYRAGKQPNC